MQGRNVDVQISPPNHRLFNGLTAKHQGVMLASQRAIPRALGAEPLGRDASEPITELLERWRGGDPVALDALVPLVYSELRQIAHHYLQRERSDHTLQSTALVHEAYVRLVGHNIPAWQDRAHFFGVAARVMRQILVEYARGHRAAKRGGDVCKVTLEEGLQAPQPMNLDVMMLDDALKNLADLDPQQSLIIELRFFGGLSIEDTSEVLGVSPATVSREWTSARAWLHREISRGPSA
jgi:RNA polymerase sigma factor (TIGR02999 family)